MCLALATSILRPVMARFKYVVRDVQDSTDKFGPDATDCTIVAATGARARGTCTAGDVTHITLYHGFAPEGQKQAATVVVQFVRGSSNHKGGANSFVVAATPTS